MDDIIRVLFSGVGSIDFVLAEEREKGRFQFARAGRIILHGWFGCYCSLIRIVSFLSSRYCIALSLLTFPFRLFFFSAITYGRAVCFACCSEDEDWPARMHLLDLISVICTSSQY